jgi:hypothetical protein
VNKLSGQTQSNCGQLAKTRKSGVSQISSVWLRRIYFSRHRGNVTYLIPLPTSGKLDRILYRPTVYMTCIEHDVNPNYLLIQNLSNVAWSRYGVFRLRILVNFVQDLRIWSRSLCPRGLRHKLTSLDRTLGSWVRIPLTACMSVCVYSVFVLPCV